MLGTGLKLKIKQLKKQSRKSTMKRLKKITSMMKLKREWIYLSKHSRNQRKKMKNVLRLIILIRNLIFHRRHLDKPIKINQETIEVRVDLKNQQIKEQFKVEEVHLFYDQ
jgi:hypothetical protein